MTKEQITARIRLLNFRLDHLAINAPLRFGAAIRTEIRVLQALLAE